MAGKSDADRRREIVGAGAVNGYLKTIIDAQVSVAEGTNAQQRARQFLQNNPRVIGKLHIGRLGRPEGDKPARNAIRAAMLLAWMHYPQSHHHRDAEEYATQIKEWFRNKQRAEIEQGVALLWNNLIEYNNNYYYRRNNPAQKQNFLNNHPEEYLKYYALGPAGTIGAAHWLDAFRTHSIPNASRTKRMYFHKPGDRYYNLQLLMHHVGAIPLNSQEYYWLPWRTKYITSITLPANPPVNSPTLFFTAYLNGCSVFIERRPPNNDVFVHHAGIEGRIGPELIDNLPAGVHVRTRGELMFRHTERFWRELYLDLIRVPVPALGRNMNNVVEVNKTRYIGTQRLQTFEDRMRNILTHRGIRDQDIRDHLRLKGSACVMGIRQGANWRFYLQENVGLEYPVSRNRRLRTTLSLCVSRVDPNPAVIWDGTLQKLPGAIADPDIDCQN